MVAWCPEGSAAGSSSRFISIAAPSPNLPEWPFSPGHTEGLRCRGRLPLPPSGFLGVSDWPFVISDWSFKLAPNPWTLLSSLALLPTVSSRKNKPFPSRSPHDVTVLPVSRDSVGFHVFSPVRSLRSSGQSSARTGVEIALGALGGYQQEAVVDQDKWEEETKEAELGVHPQHPWPGLRALGLKQRGKDRPLPQGAKDVGRQHFTRTDFLLRLPTMEFVGRGRGRRGRKKPQSAYRAGVGAGRLASRSLDRKLEGWFPSCTGRTHNCFPLLGLSCSSWRTGSCRRPGAATVMETHIIPEWRLGQRVKLDGPLCFLVHEWG